MHLLVITQLFQISRFLKVNCHVLCTHCSLFFLVMDLHVHIDVYCCDFGSVTGASSESRHASA